MRISLFAVLLGAALVVGAAADAQQPAPAAPVPYGPSLDIAQAKKAASAAVAKAKETGYPSSVAVVGPGGELIYVERMDNTFNASAELAVRKAQSAATFRRPTMAFEQALASGHTLVLDLGATVVGGGIPIVMKGRIVGAIGVSGAPTSDPDVAAAQAGVDALK